MNAFPSNHFADETNYKNGKKEFEADAANVFEFKVQKVLYENSRIIQQTANL